MTLLFWVMKIVAVTLGETTGDLFGITFGIGYVTTALIFLMFFLVVVTLQVKATRLHAALFWAVVLGTSMVGTEISDFLNRGFGHGSATNGVGYAWGAVILTSVLLAVFLAWWRTGQTYDVENIASRRGEILYWIAILVSNTLGTSTGDWLSDDTGLGFRDAFLIIAGIMLLIVAAHYLTAINGTVLFWLAFVLTRPLGAAGGDSLTKPMSDGGLGWGTSWASAALVALLVVLIAHQTTQLRRQPLEPLAYPHDRRTGQAQHPNGAVVTGIPAPRVISDAVPTHPRLAESTDREQ
ncbi:MAG TPA: hypothetical protein VHX38_20420 [Pseudonocardiaceae bacterium]|nr:hypothetical protein [Pseudonocardiaceae bacterium]